MIYKYIKSAEEDTEQARIIQPHAHSLILGHKQCLNILSHTCDYYYNYLLHECSEFLVTTMPVRVCVWVCVLTGVGFIVAKHLCGHYRTFWCVCVCVGFFFKTCSYKQLTFMIRKKNA